MRERNNDNKNLKIHEGRNRDWIENIEKMKIKNRIKKNLRSNTT